MLDGVARAFIDPALNAVARRIAERNISPDAITVAGFMIGLASAGLIALHGPPALILGLMGISRVADGLDGAVARANGKPSDAGGFLDIVLDFAFYGAIPLAFALRQPDANALAAAALLFAFYVNSATFLGYAAIAARRGIDAAPRGPKALVFSSGLAEATETLAVFAAMVVWPHLFPLLAWGFAALCLLTAALRLIMAIKTFR